MADWTPDELRLTQARLSDVAIRVGDEIARIDADTRSIIGSDTPAGRILEGMQIQKVTIKSWFDTVAEFTTYGTISSIPATKKQVAGLATLGGKLINNYADSSRAVAQYELGNLLFNSLIDAALQLSGSARQLNSIADGLLSLADKVVKAAPWIIGALVFGPFVLRTFLGYKEGGSTGAAKAAAAELEGGRAAAKSAISRFSR